MLGSLINRFRIGMLLLAFAAALAGQGAANAAMMPNMQAAMSTGADFDSPCPGCPGDQNNGMTTPCGAFGCWTVPALLPQTTRSEPVFHVTFAFPPDVVVTSMATAPDPHPPRSNLPA